MSNICHGFVDFSGWFFKNNWPKNSAKLVLLHIVELS